MITTILGLEPDAFANVLRIVRPKLPKRVNHLEVRDLFVGTTCVDLLFDRAGTEITVRAENIRGDLKLSSSPDRLRRRDSEFQFFDRKAEPFCSETTSLNDRTFNGDRSVRIAWARTTRAVAALVT